jgi:hypothetical protein
MTSPPSSSSDLFEDSSINPELQNKVKNNAEIDRQNETTTTELQENNDNNATSG